MRILSQSGRWLMLAVLVGIAAQIAAGQTFTTTNPGDILQQFRNMRTTWMTNVWVFANQLFGILAVIEFTWSAIVMALDKSDLQAWTAALVRRIMWIGAFYALLINGRTWIPAIISSFEMIGQTASGTPGIAPSDVFAQGIDIAGALMDAASSSAFFTNPGSSLALAISALLIVISYVVITLNYIVTMVESYLVISAGFIMLGFGGSRWTAPYVERYLGLAVSIGIKIVLIYCLVSAGFGLGAGWLSEAQSVGTSPNPAMTAFDVMGAALIFMMLCWQIPKLFGAVLGGAPALTGGDLAATGTAVVAGAAAMGVAGTGAGSSLAAAVSAGTSATGVGARDFGGAPLGGLGIGSVGSAGTASDTVPPPSSPTGVSSPGVQPDPPASPAAPASPGIMSHALQSADGLMRGTQQHIRGARGRLGPLSDAAPPPSPPRMPIHHDND